MPLPACHRSPEPPPRRPRLPLLAGDESPGDPFAACFSPSSSNLSPFLVCFLSARKRAGHAPAATTAGASFCTSRACHRLALPSPAVPGRPVSRPCRLVPDLTGRSITAKSNCCPDPVMPPWIRQVSRRRAKSRFTVASSASPTTSRSYSLVVPLTAPPSTSSFD